MASVRLCAAKMGWIPAGSGHVPRAAYKGREPHRLKPVPPGSTNQVRSTCECNLSVPYLRRWQ